MVVAMAVAASVSGLVRRPPWRQKSAAEALLRIVLGFGVGALIAWLTARFLDAPLPFAVPPLERGVSWLEHASVFAAFVGTVTGLLVSIEPTPLPEPLLTPDV